MEKSMDEGSLERRDEVQDDLSLTTISLQSPKIIMAIETNSC